MIVSFKNAGVEDIFDGKNSRAARQTCPQQLWRVALRKLEQVDSATALSDLYVPPSNHVEALKQDRMGQHSIRINDQYWVCFTWTEVGATDVEITDYHD